MSHFYLSGRKDRPPVAAPPHPQKQPQQPTFAPDFELGTGYLHGFQHSYQTVDSDDFHVTETTLADLVQPTAPRPPAAMDSSFAPATMSLSGMMENQGKGKSRGLPATFAPLPQGLELQTPRFSESAYGITKPYVAEPESEPEESDGWNEGEFDIDAYMADMGVDSDDDDDDSDGRGHEAGSEAGGEEPGAPSRLPYAPRVRRKPVPQMDPHPQPQPPAQEAAPPTVTQQSPDHDLRALFAARVGHYPDPHTHAHPTAQPQPQPHAHPQPHSPLHLAPIQTGTAMPRAMEHVHDHGHAHDHNYDPQTPPLTPATATHGVNPAPSPGSLPVTPATPQRGPHRGEEAYTRGGPPSRPAAGASGVTVPVSAAPLRSATAMSTPNPVPVRTATTSSSASAASTATAPPHSRQRPPAQTKASMSADGHKVPLEGTFYFDPTLQNKLFNVPRTISSTTDAALSGLSAYDDGKNFSWVTGAPINGVAKLAKSYLIPADAKFESENGGVSLRIGVIDERGHGQANGAEDAEEVDVDGKGKGKSSGGKRTVARVQVSSNRGGVEVDIIEIDANRQLDLSIETAAGDVLVLLPDHYTGAVSVNCPDGPNWGRCLLPAMDRVVPMGETQHRTVVIPLPVRQARRDAEAADKTAKAAVSRGISKAASKMANSRLGTKATTKANTTVGGAVKSTMESAVMQKIASYIPAPVANAAGYVEGYMPMVHQGYASWAKNSHSKIAITTVKGTVLVGYRESPDKARAAELEMRVGAGSKPKNWFKSVF